MLLLSMACAQTRSCRRSHGMVKRNLHSTVRFSIADQVNDSFPAFMERAFHCPRDMGELIKAGRETVADRGLFITKKRYAVNAIDIENKRVDVNGAIGKTKATGLDLETSQTHLWLFKTSCWKF
jgi:hypothetical protein